ncbi:MAG: stage III sporulation protein AA [Clostridiales bacterium]|nr:stage III sporulation protein AA [Clostridiales bacterium]
MISLMRLLPGELLNPLSPLPADLTDLRLRPHRPAELVSPGKSRLAGPDVPPQGIERALTQLSRHSLYAWEEELTQGFFTLSGGERVGVCGRFAVEGGRVTALSRVYSVAIRVSRQVAGAADRLMPYLYEDGRPVSALILSPPGLGKTTLLRDAIRQLSSGTAYGRAARVAVADERCELAACSSGGPTMDLGPRADVVDGCPKRLAMPLMVRALSPDVIATDELGQAGDAEAALDAVRCGVRVLASVHAADYQAARARPQLRELLASGAFDRVATLAAVGQLGQVLDGRGRPIAR